MLYLHFGLLDDRNSPTAGFRSNLSMWDPSQITSYPSGITLEKKNRKGMSHTLLISGF